MTAKLLTIREVSDMLSAPPSSIRDLVRVGKLTAINLGTGKRKSLRFEPQEVEAFIERSRTQAVSPKETLKPPPTTRLLTKGYEMMKRFGYSG